MKILVISSSMRADSQSLKVSNWLNDNVQELGCESSVLDLHELKLPLFDNGESVSENTSIILDMLEAADGYVFVSPEWNGMMSHGLINMLHYVNAKTMADKPVMLAGVSGSKGGQYPLAQMRQIGAKNRHYVITPEQLVFAPVNEMLNDNDMSETAPDLYMKTRSIYALKMLIEYSKALSSVRSSMVSDYDTYPNGM